MKAMVGSMNKKSSIPNISTTNTPKLYTMSLAYTRFPHWSELWECVAPSGPQIVWEHVRVAVCDVQQKVQYRALTGTEQYSALQTLSRMFKGLRENPVKNEFDAVVFLAQLVTDEAEEEHSVLLSSIFSNSSNDTNTTCSCSIVQGLQQSLCEPFEPILKAHVYLILQHLVYNAAKTAACCEHAKRWIAGIWNSAESKERIPGNLGDICKFAGLEQTLSPPIRSEWLDEFNTSSSNIKLQRKNQRIISLRKKIFNTGSSTCRDTESTGPDMMVCLLCQSFLQNPKFVPCNGDIEWLEQYVIGSKSSLPPNLMGLISKIKINRRMLVALLCLALRSGNLRTQVKVLKLVNISAIFNKEVIMNMCAVPGLIPILVSLLAIHKNEDFLTPSPNEQDIEAEHRLIANKYHNLIVVFSAIVRIGARALVGFENESDSRQRATAQISILLLIFATTRSAFSDAFAWKVQGSILRAMVCSSMSSSSMWCSQVANEQHIHFVATAMSVELFVQNLHLRRQRLLQKMEQEQMNIAQLRCNVQSIGSIPLPVAISVIGSKSNAENCITLGDMDQNNLDYPKPEHMNRSSSENATDKIIHAGVESSSTTQDTLIKNEGRSQKDTKYPKVLVNNCTTQLEGNDALNLNGTTKATIEAKSYVVDTIASICAKTLTTGGNQSPSAHESSDMLRGISFTEVSKAAVELLDKAAKHDICSDSDSDMSDCEDQSNTSRNETQPGSRCRRNDFSNPVRVLSTLDIQQLDQLVKTEWAEELKPDAELKLRSNYQNLHDTSAPVDSPYASCWLESISTRRRTSFSVVDSILEGLRSPKALSVSKLSKTFTKLTTSTSVVDKVNIQVKVGENIGIDHRKQRSKSCFQFSQIGNMDADLDFMLACCLQVFRLCGIRGNLQRDIEHHTSQCKCNDINIIKISSTLSSNLTTLRHAISNGLLKHSTPRKAFRSIPLTPLFPSFNISNFETKESAKLPKTSKMQCVLEAELPKLKQPKYAGEKSELYEHREGISARERELAVRSP